jgi:hypothetical protein
MILVDCRLESRIIICLLKTTILDSYDKNSHNYYTPLSFFLYKNMTVVLLFHPKNQLHDYSPGGAGQKL